MIQNLIDYDEVQLRAMHQQITDEIKRRREIKSLQNRVLFTENDRVEYTSSRKGRVETGIITKINRTKAVVRSDSDSKLWNVPLSMLRLRNKTATVTV